ncbi:MbcA/ParS/Xre antitoxin family protein [Algoriphagus sp. AK58]|uniref:MbcA/ParS/Xre antitoxin family protein n=1 Tax=Algoriphagus sp. AK58 TaxID=1406877 RepID=UPI0021020CA5|nr:MbcA/ParS/Xre antitoxin family protein [Algoriphagus sp. AK58]
MLEIKDIAMSTTWRIRFDDQRTEVLESGPRAYHFFTQSPSIVAEQREQYGEAVLDFHETSPFFDYLDFTSQDVAELLEVDPSTLFRWKKDDRKLSKAITKNLLEMDQIIAKGIRIFGSEELMAEWLHTPNAALSSQKPVDLFKNPYKIALVDQALEAISWGNIL